ncbi:hypothetical protein SPRA44_310005 [Serratia proteamaculans]|nr:hypothetical protein SPRA44_310005 [Serratia proteamaculans]
MSKRLGKPILKTTFKNNTFIIFYHKLLLCTRMASHFFKDCLSASLAQEPS